MKRGLLLATVAIVPCIHAPAAAQAPPASPVGGAVEAVENEDSLRAHYRLPLPPPVPVVLPGIRTPPGSSVGSPTAFGPGFGEAYVGAGFQGRARYSDGMDGVVGAGFGLGNPRTAVGLEVAYTSFSTVNSGFFEYSGVGLKLHRLFPGNVGVAVGWENAWTSSRQVELYGETSVYAVVSQVIDVNEAPLGQLTTSLGVGTGRFRSEQRILDDEGGVGFFASLGLRLLERVSMVLDWTGQDLAIGYSIAPFADFPLVITPAIVDVTGSAGDGVRFVLGAGSGFHFADLGL